MAAGKTYGVGRSERWVEREEKKKDSERDRDRERN
jgi:hypothetical protein